MSSSFRLRAAIAAVLSFAALPLVAQEGIETTPTEEAAPLEGTSADGVAAESAGEVNTIAVDGAVEPPAAVPGDVTEQIGRAHV